MPASIVPVTLVLLFSHGAGIEKLLEQFVELEVPTCSCANKISRNIAECASFLVVAMLMVRRAILDRVVTGGASQES